MAISWVWDSPLLWRPSGGSVPSWAYLIHSSDNEAPNSVSSAFVGHSVGCEPPDLKGIRPFLCRWPTTQDMGPALLVAEESLQQQCAISRRLPMSDLGPMVTARGLAQC